MKMKKTQYGIALSTLNTYRCCYRTFNTWAGKTKAKSFVKTAVRQGASTTCILMALRNFKPVGRLSPWMLTCAIRYMQTEGNELPNFHRAQGRVVRARFAGNDVPSPRGKKRAITF